MGPIFSGRRHVCLFNAYKKQFSAGFWLQNAPKMLQTCIQNDTLVCVKTPRAGPRRPTTLRSFSLVRRTPPRVAGTRRPTIPQARASAGIPVAAARFSSHFWWGFDPGNALKSVNNEPPADRGAAGMRCGRNRGGGRAVGDPAGAGISVGATRLPTRFLPGFASKMLQKVLKLIP
eukprot:gene11301-biopygen6355